jgi:hypothetical protein
MLAVAFTVQGNVSIKKPIFPLIQTKPHLQASSITFRERWILEFGLTVVATRATAARGIVSLKYCELK